PGVVLDGEIVKPTDKGVSFFELQRRLSAPVRERPSIAAESPVAYVAFDILRDSSEDVRRLRLTGRRKRLERVISGAETSSLLQLIVQTDDPNSASAWLDDAMSMTGIEGVVAKLDEPYPKPTARR